MVARTMVVVTVRLDCFREQPLAGSRGWDRLEVGNSLGCQSCRELTSFERTKAPRLVRTETLASVGVKDQGA